MGRVSMPQGKGSQMHNRRDYEQIGRAIPDNIDTALSGQNLTLVDRDIHEAYDEFFGQALQEYNDRQKRADRKIYDYYEHISKSKNGENLFYEDVLQWGKKEDFEAHPELRETVKECLVEYVKGFETRNPSLKLIGAYIHMDEASPHLHLDYVPVAHGYTRGLSVRNSLDRAMKEMGYLPEKESRKNNATKLWKEHERAYFGSICLSRGLEVEAERSARGSLSVDEYKAAKEAMLAEVEQEKSCLAAENAKLASDLAQKQSEMHKVDAITALMAQEGPEKLSLENYTIPEKKSLFGKIEAPERHGTFIEGLAKDEVKAMVQRIKVDNGLSDVFDQVQLRCNQILIKATTDAKEIRLDASAERNETVAKAQEVLANEQSIIQRAMDWVAGLKKKYDELVKKINELLHKKASLEQEVAHLEAYKAEIEPLKQKHDDLARATQILAGKLDYELTEARFRPARELDPNFKCIALYKDGTQRAVDLKSLDDQEHGLCQIGAFAEEVRIKVPKSLLTELIAARDRSKPLSQNLQSLIKQQNDLNKTISKHHEISR